VQYKIDYIVFTLNLSIALLKSKVTNQNTMQTAGVTNGFRDNYSLVSIINSL